MKKSDYSLKAHEFYLSHILKLTARVKKLRRKLKDEEYFQHPLVKFAKRVRGADGKIIPQDPDRPDYRLHGPLKKYRRYKQGLQRYRLFFAFSSRVKIIIYLYLNEEREQRQAGGKNDPYENFLKFVKKGHVSHDPNDPAIQKWVRNYSSKERKREKEERRGQREGDRVKPGTEGRREKGTE